MRPAEHGRSGQRGGQGFDEGNQRGWKPLSLMMRDHTWV